MEENFPDFFFFINFALDKEVCSGLLLVLGQTRSAWILKLGHQAVEALIGLYFVGQLLLPRGSRKW